MAVSVRPIQPADIDLVRTMHYAHLTSEAKADYLKVNAAAAARNERIFSGLEGLCLVAHNNTRVVGYLIGLSEDHRPAIQYAKLDAIFVAPEYRRNGIGSKFVTEFSAWAKAAGAERVSVDVSPRNRDAINFYQRHGFVQRTIVMEQTI